jgi:hypothetical protein
MRGGGPRRPIALRRRSQTICKAAAARRATASRDRLAVSLKCRIRRAQAGGELRTGARGRSPNKRRFWIIFFHERDLAGSAGDKKNVRLWAAGESVSRQDSHAVHIDDGIGRFPDEMKVQFLEPCREPGFSPKTLSGHGHLVMAVEGAIGSFHSPCKVRPLEVNAGPPGVRDQRCLRDICFRCLRRALSTRSRLGGGGRIDARDTESPPEPAERGGWRSPPRLRRRRLMRCF